MVFVALIQGTVNCLQSGDPNSEVKDIGRRHSFIKGMVELA